MTRPEHPIIPLEASTSPEDVPSLLEPILPACSVNLLAGAPGAGKTTLLAGLTVRFRDGLDVFGYRPTYIPRQVFIGADRSWLKSTRKWFILAGYPDIEAYSLQDDTSFRKARLRKKQDRMAILRHCFTQFHPALQPGTLIWVDPLSLFLGGNLIDYDTCLVACSEIRELCQEHGVTLIGTAHASKQKADKAQRYLRLQDRIAGSVALFGYTDTQMYLAAPEEISEDFSLFHWNPHHSKPESFKLTRAENGLFVPYEDPESGREGELLELIPTSPQLIGAGALIALAAERAISKATCYRFLETLREHGAVLKVGHGNYTRPKTH